MIISGAFLLHQTTYMKSLKKNWMSVQPWVKILSLWPLCVLPKGENQILLNPDYKITLTRPINNHPTFTASMEIRKLLKLLK